MSDLHSDTSSSIASQPLPRGGAVNLPDPTFALLRPSIERVPTIMVGDTHATRVDLLIEDLNRVSAVDASGHLTSAFTGVVVQMGDTVDRGVDDWAQFNFWRNLQSEAVHRVGRLLGNHELAHLLGAGWSIRCPEIPGLQQALIDDIQRGLITAAWSEGDVLYTHAGVDLTLFPEYRGAPTHEIALDLNRRLVRFASHIRPGAENAEYNLGMARLNVLTRSGGIDGRAGIFWARQPIENDQFRQVVGHTPQLHGIDFRPGLRVKYIDAARVYFENEPDPSNPRAGRALACNSATLSQLGLHTFKLFAGQEKDSG